MLSYILALVLAIIVMLSLVLKKAYYFLPAKELKRQAEMGDPLAKQFWRAVAYGPSLRVFLWLAVGFASAGCTLLLARVAPPLLGFAAVVLLLLLFAWLPGSRLTNVEVRLGQWLTPAVAWLVGTLEPVLSTIAGFGVRHQPAAHTGVYVREDLLELIERQKDQPDNRLSTDELNLAAAALQFGHKKVREHMTPRANVQTVSSAEVISPVFLDELHRKLYDHFLVYEGEPDNFVGTLYLHELTAISMGSGAHGTIADHMNKGVVYVHENDSLADALHAFYASKKPIFVVVNSFEEYTGIITIDDILHALLGRGPAEEAFDQHENKAAVAARHSHKPKPVDATIDENGNETSPEQPLEQSKGSSAEEAVDLVNESPDADDTDSKSVS